MKQKPYRIDVHHHAIPSEVVESFNKLGITEMGGGFQSLFLIQNKL